MMHSPIHHFDWLFKWMLARDYRISFGLNEIKVQQFDDIDGISHNQSLFDKS